MTEHTPTDVEHRLIAANQAMLAALKMVAAQINTIDNIANPQACKAVRDAIAQAENV